MKMARWLCLLSCSVVVFLFPSRCDATEPALESDASRFHKDYESVILPLLEKHCYDCHGYGESEGGLTLDHFESAQHALEDPELWFRVVKNIRAGVMPPPDTSELVDSERAVLFEWIKFGPFGIDPADVDPGPVPLRRLNRAEYGNTIRELMGIPFDEKLIFPPDDSGHGFDNVADALMVSPLLLEKYVHAAEKIVAEAVPTETWIIPRQELGGEAFRSVDPNQRRVNGRFLNAKHPAKLRSSLSVNDSGSYRVSIRVKQHGSFEFDPARYVVVCLIDGEERFTREFGWDEHKATDFLFEEDWSSGEHVVEFDVSPVAEDNASTDELVESNPNTSVHFQIERVRVEGPIGTEKREHSKNYQRFFHLDEPPIDAESRREYAHEVLSRFVARAFRSEPESKTVARLVQIAETNYARPGVSFEEGMSRAFVAALVSPKFLFRIDSIVEEEPSKEFALVDELSLASRLSYFLWSSMPDSELIGLAKAGQLRSNLDSQIDRMLDDGRSKAFVSNFAGQWLRTRDVINSNVDPAVVLGVAEELDDLRQWFSSRFRDPGRRDRNSEESRAKMGRFRELRAMLGEINDDLKRSMRAETELMFEHIVKTDASLLDLLDCDYTFLNEDLARHYGIPDVSGDRMRFVQLPKDSPRGGVLTQASMLLITSNPTRTSPVKRGLFVLENILGTPAPPAPAVVPELEESASAFGGREPTLRELLEVHRENALCASCHARMDPIGLALENFNALGMWRDAYDDAPIMPDGELVTGETFNDIRELKRVLREHHARDFYRCVTEKLLTFAIGRGIEFNDEHTVDIIVDELEESGGDFRSLVHAVIQSAPFQKQRRPAAP